MSNQEINSKNQEITSCLLSGKINKALKLLSELVYISHNSAFISEYEKHSETYKNILKYSFEYANDPERNKIYNYLSQNILELNDLVSSGLKSESEHILKELGSAQNPYMFMNSAEMNAIIDNLLSERRLSGLIEETDNIVEVPKENTENYKMYLQKVFSQLLSKDVYVEAEVNMVGRVLSATEIPIYDKCLIISAVTLSLLRKFNINKLELLFDAYSNESDLVANRSLTGIILALIKYNDRYTLYPQIAIRLKSVSDAKLLAQRTEQILIQFIKAKDTEKVTEKIQKEIIPEVMKMRPDIEEKLKLDELLSEDAFGDKNPEWEKVFGESSDVYKKLEEFSMMQMDGSDVFMGAFSMLKRFGFFEDLSNWFLPFYKGHPEIKKSTSGSGVDENFDWDKFFEGIEKAPVMCNSDKYSFCFNIGFMPDMQKKMMLDLFNSELNAMNEMVAEDNKNNNKTKDRFQFTQYIQDLYRFFKLYPKKQLFEDVFDVRFAIEDLNMLNDIFSDNSNLHRIAEYYFSKNDYELALSLFNKLLEESANFELSEKAGFCYQKLGNYNKALQLYHNAEIYEANRVWLLKKVGFCYHAISDFEKAINYYKKVEALEPDNLEVQVQLGQLHIDKEEYDKALQYYFKVEYLKPDLKKVQRPIAWCNFMLNKMEKAERYFKKVIENGGGRSDHLNLGHVLWVNKQSKEAIESYKNAFKLSGSDADWFSEALLADSKYLVKYNIESLEISLMADYISSEV